MKINFTKDLTKENVLDELKRKGYNDYDLVSFYIPEFKGINKKIKSTLRADDKNNSMAFKIINGRIMISDFGYKTGLDIFSYLIELYFHPYKDGFYKALDLVVQDFDLPIERYRYRGSHFSQSRRPREYPKKFKKELDDTPSSIIQTVSKKQFSKKDEEYWNQYGLSGDDFKKNELRAINHFFIKKNNKELHFNVKNELAFVYIFLEENTVKKKVYLPYGLRGNMNFKFVGNVSNKNIFNLRFIPKSGNLLLITSSGKDAKVLNKYVGPSIAPQAEGQWLHENIWYKLRANYRNIIYFGNNDFHKKDNPGLYYCRKHCKEYYIPWIVIPTAYKVSDPSDFIKEYGLDKFLELRDDLLYPNINLLCY